MVQRNQLSKTCPDSYTFKGNKIKSPDMHPIRDTKKNINSLFNEINSLFNEIVRSESADWHHRIDKRRCFNGRSEYGCMSRGLVAEAVVAVVVMVHTYI